MQKPVIFKSGRYDLYGILHYPARLSVGKPVPVVVFFHGFTGNKVEAHRIFVKTARELEKYRIASLRFDFRGCGDSGGNFHDTTVLGEVEDAKHALNFVCRQPGIDRHRVGVVGLSLGGTVSAYAAGRDHRIKALAMWAPAADLIEEAQQMRTDKEIKQIRSLRAVDYYGTLVGRDFINEIPKIKPTKVIENYNGTAIIIHGTKDDSVPLKHSLAYYNILKKKGLNVTRHLIKNSDHVFSSYDWEKQVINKTVKYFNRNLRSNHFPWSK